MLKLWRNWMKHKVIQYFSDDYLKECKKMKPYDIVKFLDEFRQLHGGQVENASKAKTDKDTYS
jgi:hypothetical protein